MKYKSKPIHKIEIREAVEKKFQARGGIIFHACLLLFGTVLFLAYLPTAWGNLLTSRWDSGLKDSAILFGILGLSFAMNFFRYHFRHGTGFEKHQAETATRINRRLQRTDPGEWEEQEELIRIQQQDKLKNRRLLWQHMAVFLSVGLILFTIQFSVVAGEGFSDWSDIINGLNVMGIWSIGILAHSLRYYLAYGHSREKRQAKIDAEVARELAALERESPPVNDRQAQGAPGMGTSQERITIGASVAEDLEEPRREMKA
ncbi:MAG: 2TM domain-containing protein [Chloroflexi bacterium]|nr:2TM domain-containing protein [Chloroflexota bacterium]